MDTHTWAHRCRQFCMYGNDIMGGILQETFEILHTNILSVNSNTWFYTEMKFQKIVSINLNTPDIGKDELDLTHIACQNSFVCHWCNENKWDVNRNLLLFPLFVDVFHFSIHTDQITRRISKHLTNMEMAWASTACDWSSDVNEWTHKCTSKRMQSN